MFKKVVLSTLVVIGAVVVAIPVLYLATALRLAGYGLAFWTVLKVLFGIDPPLSLSVSGFAITILSGFCFMIALKVLNVAIEKTLARTNATLKFLKSLIFEENADELRKR